MSVLTILTFQPQISWPYGGSTATLRIKYSANFTDSLGQAVLRGLFKDVPCTIAAGVPTVPQFDLITTNDALVNPLVTCSAQFIDSSGAARDWLFQNFSIPQVLTPSCAIGSLFTYNQGSALVLPPQFYLSRDQTTALVTTMLAALGFGPATELALGIVRLSAAAAVPADPVVWEQGDPNARDAQKLKGVDLDATMASPADTNVVAYDALSDTWKPTAAATGDVVGPSSATDNAIPLYDGVTGKLLKDSPITFDGTDLNLTGSRVIASEYDSDSANLASNGTIRLGKDDFIAWRNEANGGNILLEKDAGDRIASSGGFAGNLLGNVLGNVVGDVLGDLTGDVTGNVSGTASNLSGTPALPDGTTATTQAPSDNSTKLATTAYVDAVVPPGGGYTTVEDEGTPLAQRSTMNFVGAGVTATDAGGVTVVTIPGGGGSTDVLEVQVFS